jgi:hypothetical protein
LSELRQQHNILLVTNDHVETLKTLADNIIVVSAEDRSTVQVNSFCQVDRDKAILALSVGNDFVYTSSMADLYFFFEVEVVRSAALRNAAVFTVGGYALFLATYWNSNTSSGALVIVASTYMSLLCLNAYLLTLVDWRDHMREEAEALLHSSVTMNTALKCILSTALFVVISLLQWGAVATVGNGFESFTFWIYIFMDNAFGAFPFIYLGLYTSLSAVAVETVGILPFLFTIFFSTAFSPGSGLPGLKALRYLFPR